MSLEFTVAIPARFGASRLPGKPLRLLRGEPMVLHVARRGLEAGASAVVVATDDARIVDALAPLQAQGFLQVCMTDPSLPSGTDRLAACARALAWAPERIVVNLQGDEPLAPPSAIRAAATCLAEGDCEIATLAQPLHDADGLFDPNCVKLVRNALGNALYFSRAPIPWARDAFARDRLQLPGGGWLRHIGLYAYRVRHLLEFAAMPPGWLEQTEALEQLRALEAGWRIGVALSPEPFPAGVDTEADLERLEILMAEAGA